MLTFERVLRVGFPFATVLELASCHQNVVSSTVLAPGQVIQRPGSFRSNDGSVNVTILDQGSDEFELQISSTEHNRNGGASWRIGKNEDWCLTLDENNTCWVYSVKNGVRSFQSTAEGPRVTTAGEGGGWQGIPVSMVEKLPVSERLIYDTWIEKRRSQPPTTLE